MQKWFLYRPVFENKITMHELKTCVTIEEVFEINALLDMQEDINSILMQEQEKKCKK